MLDFTASAERLKSEASRDESALSGEILPNFIDQMLSGVICCQLVERNGCPEFAYRYANQAFRGLMGLEDGPVAAIPSVENLAPELFQAFGRVVAGAPPEIAEIFVASRNRSFSVQVYCPKAQYLIAIFDAMAPGKAVPERQHAPPAAAPKNQGSEGERLRALSVALEQSPAAVLVLDLDGGIQYVNARFTELTGYGSGEVRGRNVRMLQSGLTPWETYEQMWNSLRRGRPWRGEMLNRKKNGLLYWEESHIAPIRDDEGAITHYIEIQVDITERKALEKRLAAAMRESEDLYHKAPCGYHSVGADGTILRINDTELSWLGYSREEVVGRKKFTDLVTPEGRELFTRTFPRFMQEGHMEDLHFRLVGKEGQTRDVAISATAVRDDSGRFRMSRSVAFDITELQRTADRLRDLNHDFTAFLENTPDFVYFIDGEHRFRFCSQSMAKIARHGSWRQMVGKHLLEIFPEDTARIYVEDNQAVLREGKPLLHKMDPYYDDAGNKGWLITDKWPLFDANGEAVGILGISRDISERLALQQQLKNRVALFHGIFDQSTFLAAILDEQGMLMDVNTAALRLIDAQPPDVLGGYFPDTPWWARSPDRPKIVRSLEEAGTGTASSFEAVMLNAKGSDVHVYVNAQPVTLQTGFRVAVTCIDVTDRWLAEQELRESEQRFRAMADNAPVLIWLSGLDGQCFYFNKVWLDFTGRSLEQEMGDGWAEGVHPDDLQRCLDTYLSAFDRRQEFTMEYRLRRQDGEYRWILDNGVPRYDDQGTFYGYIGSCIDITERHEVEEFAQRLAYYDPLTQLANRRLMSDRLGQAIVASRRHRKFGAVIFLDLDHFKPLNDAHGHAAGDLLLIEVAKRICLCVREMDTVARFGGDEFIVLLGQLDTDEATSRSDAGRVAEKIRLALAEPFRLAVRVAGNRVVDAVHCCTSSIGIALFKDDQASTDEVLKQADQAMYRAKESGRNAIHFHDAAQ